MPVTPNGSRFLCRDSTPTVCFLTCLPSYTYTLSLLSPSAVAQHTSLEKYLESVHNSVVSSALMTAEQRLLKDYDDFVEARLQDLLEEDKRKLMQAYGRAAMTSDGADSALAFGAAAGAAETAAAAAASTGGSAALSGAAGAFSAQAKAMNDARDQRRTYSGAARLAKAAREHGAAQAARCVYEVLSSMLGEQEAVRGAGSAALVASGTSGEMALVAGARESAPLPSAPCE